MVEGSWHTVAGGAGHLWGYKSLGGIRSRPRPESRSRDVRILGIWRNMKIGLWVNRKGFKVSKVVNDGKEER